MRGIDMAKVTRLTRTGRLNEAFAVLTGSEGAPEKETGITSPSLVSKVLHSVLAPSEAGATGMPRLDLSRVPESVSGLLDRLAPGALARTDRSGKPQPLPPGARFEAHEFASTWGSRPYKLYVPSGARGQALPLVVMLHGCTQSPDDFAAGTQMNDVAEEELFYVAYPGQTRAANSSGCWNWFRTADQQRDKGEPALIADLTREILRTVPVQLGRVYIAGLSAGGAAAAVLGQTYPELYAAVGVHSGLACGAAADAQSAFAAMKNGGSSTALSRGKPVPTIVFHGDRDQTVSAVNGLQVAAQSASDDASTSTVEDGIAPGGMRYTRTVRSDATGRPLAEQWVLHGAGHAWAGGNAAGSYTDPRGPDASRAMARFFRHHATVSL